MAVSSLVKLSIEAFDHLWITQHGSPPRLAATFLPEEGCGQSKRQLVRTVELRHRAVCAAQEGQQHLNALAALSTTATGGGTLLGLVVPAVTAARHPPPRLSR
jgi:hypothetical protein